MDWEVVWTHEVVADLEAIADYIAKNSPAYAAAFVQETLDAGNSLDLSPRRGRVVSEYGDPHVRELFVAG